MTPTKSEYTSIELKKLSLSDTNPRGTMDDKTLGELAASIKAHGVLQPLLVRESKKGFQIISGARRFKAATLAKLKEVPCRVCTGLTDEQVRSIQIVENLQRQDILPLDEAEGIAELMKCKGYDLEVIAREIGKDLTYVTKRIKLLELIPEAKKLLKKNILNQEHINLLARLTPDQQKQILEECTREWDDLVDIEPAVRMKGKIEEMFFLDLSKAPWDKADAKLLPKAGACTACPKMAGNSRNLFDDVKKGDTCTDSVCFSAKLAAFVQIKGTELGMKAYRILDRYQHEKDTGVLGTQDWEEVPKKSCENVALGVFVNGDRIGKQIYICVRSSNCKTHFGTSTRARSNETAAEKEKRIAAERERKTEIQIRRAVILDVEKAAPEKLDGVDELRIIALALWDRSVHDVQQKILKQRDWMPEKKKGEYTDIRAYGKGKVEAMKTAAELARFCVYLALAPHMDEAPTEWDSESGERKKTADPVMTLAQKYRVDVGAIEKTIAEGKEKKSKAAAK